jgi:hypothetical protein
MGSFAGGDAAIGRNNRKLYDIERWNQSHDLRHIEPGGAG